LQQTTNLLSKGYFACTIGKSKRRAVEKYLSGQGEHHGYAQRPLPPVFVERYELSVEDIARIYAKHAAVVGSSIWLCLRLAVEGILGSQEGRTIAAE